MLFRSHAEFCRCLTISVIKEFEWTKNDVGLNKGVFLEDGDKERPREMKDMESRLSNKRIFNLNVSRYHLG